MVELKKSTFGVIGHRTGGGARAWAQVTFKVWYKCDMGYNSAVN